MKKTIAVIFSLVATVFIGSFVLSLATKKFKRQRLGQVSLSTNTDKIRAKSTDSTTDVEKVEGDAVFYGDVGGSDAEVASQPSTSVQLSRYTIEMASLESQEEAEDLLQKLRGQGIEAFYTPMRRGGMVVYKVRLGIYSNAEEAKVALSKISSVANVKGSVAKLQ